jgi:phosphatidylserine synthase
MSQKSFNLAAGILFAIVAVLHLVRSILGWDVVIAGMPIPSGVSVVVFLITTLLSYSALKLNK